MKHSSNLIILLGLLATAAPLGAQATADTVEVVIQAVPGMKFDRVRFPVAPGTPVRLVFRNADEQADMDHNLVITRPAAREKVVQAALAVTQAENYVPKLPEVLHFTPLLDQGGEYVLRFVSPAVEGAYPYVCTFPGHGFVMYGVMYVGMQMPPIAADEGVPPTQRIGPPGGAGGPGFGPGRGGRPAGPPPPRMPPLSFATTYPAVVRTFLPESGPASIAVGFEGGHSFNFDAGVAYLRYAWTGGFVDNSRHWQGNGNAYADVLGTIYYRNQVGFPFRVGAREAPEKVRYHGYRLVDSGYPEFHYSVDGAVIRERIRPREGGGLIRGFQIETVEPLRFLTDPGGGARFQSSAGRLTGGVLELTPAQARSFTITMAPQPGGTR